MLICAQAKLEDAVKRVQKRWLLININRRFTQAKVWLARGSKQSIDGAAMEPSQPSTSLTHETLLANKASQSDALPTLSCNCGPHRRSTFLADAASSALERPETSYPPPLRRVLNASSTHCSNVDNEHMQLNEAALEA